MHAMTQTGGSIRKAASEVFCHPARSAIADPGDDAPSGVFPGKSCRRAEVRQ
jgi:hypothetical protein